MATLLHLCSHLMRCLWLPYVWFYDLRLFVADLVAIHFRDQFVRLRSERAGVPRDAREIAETIDRPRLNHKNEPIVNDHIHPASCWRIFLC